MSLSFLSSFNTMPERNLKPLPAGFLNSVFRSFFCAFYRIRPLGSGSDYSPFSQRAGVPSADIRYVFDMVCALH